MGDAVVVSVPTEPLGGAGASIGVRWAFVAAGDAATGPLQVIDDVAIGPVQIPVPSVSLGSAPAGTPAGDVDFDTPASTTAGAFTATLPAAPGPRDVWALACVGASCAATRAATA